MIKSLIALDTNLASSVALCYASQLAVELPLRLQVGHVEMPDQKPHSSGTGWIHKSWELGVQNAAQQNISGLLKKERISRHLIGSPKVFIGDRDDEYLLELRRGNYDLFIEGKLNTYDIETFYNLLESPLYNNATCPLMVVKNRVQGDTICLLCGDEVDHRELISKAACLLKGDSLRFAPVFYRYQEGEAVICEQKTDDEQILVEMEEMLRDLGLQMGQALVISGMPEKVANLLTRYRLIVTSFSQARSPMQDLLAHSPLPLLLVKTKEG